MTSSSSSSSHKFRKFKSECISLPRHDILKFLTQSVNLFYTYPPTQPHPPLFFSYRDAVINSPSSPEGLRLYTPSRYTPSLWLVKPSKMKVQRPARARRDGPHTSNLTLLPMETPKRGDTVIPTRQLPSYFYARDVSFALRFSTTCRWMWKVFGVIKKKKIMRCCCCKCMIHIRKDNSLVPTRSHSVDGCSFTLKIVPTFLFFFFFN